MTNLSKNQLRLLSEILGNISVAWFVGGIVSPTFLKYTTNLETIFSIITGGLLCGAFTIFALLLIGDE